LDKKVELRVIAPTMSTNRNPYKFNEEVDMVILRCTTGDLGVLPGRLPCSMVLDTGILRIINDDKEKHMAIMGGVAHVNNDIVTILSDSALLPEDIDVEEVKAKIEEEESAIQNTSDFSQKDKHNAKIKEYKVQLELTKVA